MPECWLTGMIIHIHKKGDANLADNYRDITLLKLFTSILIRRMLNWVHDKSVLSDAQFGFRPKHDTIDAVFVLHAVINKYINDG